MIEVGPELWILIAFVAVVVLLYKKVKGAFLSAMVLHGEKVRDRLRESRDLRDETQRELVSCQKKLKDIQDEVRGMVARAVEEANQLKKEARAELERSFKAKEEKIRDRIRHEEAGLSVEIRNMLIETSTAAIARLLAAGEIDDSVLIENTIAELPDILRVHKTVN